MNIQEQIDNYLATKKPIQYTTYRIINNDVVEIPSLPKYGFEFPEGDNTYKLTRVEYDCYKKFLLKKQEHICPLCEKYIESTDSFLDYEIDSRRIRQVLHKDCHQLQRKMDLFIKHCDVDIDTYKTIVNNLSDYYDTPKRAFHNIWNK